MHVKLLILIAKEVSRLSRFFSVCDLWSKYNCALTYVCSYTFIIGRNITLGSGGAFRAQPQAFSSLSCAAFHLPFTFPWLQVFLARIHLQLLSSLQCISSTLQTKCTSFAEHLFRHLLLKTSCGFPLLWGVILAHNTLPGLATTNFSNPLSYHSHLLSGFSTLAFF